jgi:uncharacterized protein YciI
MKNYFFLKCTPSRPTFAHDMTDTEIAIMIQHVGYWKSFMEKGNVVVFGPVMDPSGPYGMGVVAAESEEQIQEFIANDPGSQIYTYEFHPLRAVLPAS